MKQKCEGCGLVLQTSDVHEPGYAKSEEHRFCQSCFRLRHYRDFKRVRAEVDDGVILDFVMEFEGTIFWIIDLMNIQQSLHPALIRHLSGKNVVLLINKRDLIPQSVSNRRLLHGIMRLLKPYPIQFTEVLFVSAKHRKSLEPILPYLLMGDVAFVGCVNVGKSSILNSLLNDDTLSVSPVASTTASIIELKVNDFTLYDTPGLQNESAITHRLSDEDLQALSPQKPIKPQVFQIYEEQALVLGGVFAVIVEPIDRIQVVSYLPHNMKRVKANRIDANLKQAEFLQVDEPQYRRRSYPSSKEDVELEIYDFGMIVIKGGVKKIEVVAEKDLEYIYRKAVL